MAEKDYLNLLINNTIATNPKFVSNPNLREKYLEPILKFAEEKREETEEKITMYQERGKKFDTEKADWMKKIKEYYLNMKSETKGSEKYNLFKNLYWKARMSATAASNRAFSAYLNAFIEATSTKWF